MTSTASESIVAKIIIIPVEAILGKKACQCGQQPAFLNKQYCARNTTLIPNGSNKSNQANKSQKPVLLNVSTVDDHPKVKPSTMGYCRKRALPGPGNVNGKQKRRKLDLIVPEPRSRISKQLGRDTLANGSKKPDKVNKLQKGVNVSSAGDGKLFAAGNYLKAKSSVKGCRKRGLPAEVVGCGPKEKRQKLVRNAMEQCSSVLKKLMSTSPNSGRKCLEAKWIQGHTKMDEGLISSQGAKNTCNQLGENGHEASPLELSLMSVDEKQKLRKQLLEVSRGNVPPCLRGFLKEIGVNCREKEGRIELDMDAFAEEILLKLKRIVRLVGDKVDPLKLQQEKARLEKQQREGDFLAAEKARKDGQIRAATVASAKAELKKKREQEREAELKKQRERERKAARLALQQVEKTIAFDDNFQVLKDFQMLTQCPLSEQYRGFQGDPKTILSEDIEEGEICEW